MKKEVWKEFFRLKWEEVSDWWYYNWEIACGIPAIIIVILHLGISLGLLCIGSSHWIKYTFYVYPLALAVFLIVVLVKYVMKKKSNVWWVIYWVYILSIIGLDIYVLSYYVNPYLYIVVNIPRLLIIGIFIVGIPCLIIYCVFIIPIKWLYSNWQQAKKNVESKLQ